MNLIDKATLSIKTIFGKQFLFFMIIGGFNTLSGVIISYILSQLVNANLAFVIGYMIGLIISYLLNSKITFHEATSLFKFIKFTISYIPNFIVQNVIVYLLYNILGFYALISYFFAAATGLPITFMIMKMFAFKKI